MIEKIKERLGHIQEHRKRHQISVQHATDGLLYALSSQPNYRYHLFFSLSAVAMGILLNISRMEWVIIAFAITLGLTVEMLNTAIESVVDLVTDQWHKDAKTAKDVSAGMMLLTAIGMTTVALIIFIPRLAVLLSETLLK